MGILECKEETKKNLAPKYAAKIGCQVAKFQLEVLDAMKTIILVSNAIQLSKGRQLVEVRGDSK